MANPKTYDPGYSFSDYQETNPTSPLPAPSLDGELADVSDAINDHKAKIEDVRRSDGALKNGIVTYDSASEEFRQWIINEATQDGAQQALDAAAAAAASAADADADATQTGLDAVATAADRVQTGLDRVATAADRVQTGLDRVQTGLDRTNTGTDAANAALAATTISCATWSALNAISGAFLNQRATVSASDGGTHTDPVVGGTVNNAGVYGWSSSPAGWRRDGSIAATGAASSATTIAGTATDQFVTPAGDKAALDARTTQLVRSDGASDPLVSFGALLSAPIVVSNPTYTRYSTPIWGTARALGDIHAMVEIDPADVANVEFCRLRIRRSDGSTFSYYNLTRNTTAGTGTGVYTVDLTAATLSVYTWKEVTVELRATSGNTIRCYGGAVTEGALYPTLEPPRRDVAIAAAVASEAATRAAADAALQATIATMLLASSTQTPDNVLKALGTASKRRVALVLCSDSNGQHQGFGLQNGWSAALGEKWPQYASPLQHWIGPVYSKQKGPYCGHECVPNDTGGTAGSYGTGGPTGINAYACVRDGYFYQPNVGASAGTEWYALDTPTPGINYLHADLALTLRFGYVKFSGAGTLNCVARRSDSPYTAVALGGDTSISLSAASLTYAEGLVTMPAATRGWGVQIGFGLPAGLSVGPLVAPLWSMLEDPTRITGWQVTSIYSVGGMAMRDWAVQMLAWTDEQIINYYKPIRAAQERVGQPPLIIHGHNFGLNDRNRGATTSVGPGAITPGDLASAYIDNFKAGRARVEAVWESQGWALEGCLWLIYGAHSFSDPEDAKLTSYRAAAAAYAATTDRVSAFDVTTVVTAAELPRYSPDGGVTYEPEHLTKEGHVLECERILTKA